MAPWSLRPRMCASSASDVCGIVACALWGLFFRLRCSFWGAAFQWPVTRVERTEVRAATRCFARRQPWTPWSEQQQVRRTKTLQKRHRLRSRCTPNPRKFQVLLFATGVVAPNAEMLGRAIITWTSLNIGESQGWTSSQSHATGRCEGKTSVCSLCSRFTLFLAVLWSDHSLCSHVSVGLLCLALQSTSFWYNRFFMQSNTSLDQIQRMLKLWEWMIWPSSFIFHDTLISLFIVID